MHGKLYFFLYLKSNIFISAKKLITMRILYFLLIGLLFFSCAQNHHTKEVEEKPITNLSIQEIYNDSVSIRAIEVVDNKDLIYGGNKTTLGYYNRKNNKHISLINRKLTDSTDLSFRAIARGGTDVFALSIGNPALLYKITEADSIQLVYKEAGEKVFYDAMAFWNESEGIAVGDPTENCMSVIITKDGGNTWEKLPCSALPKTVEGEAAFAASNTNIVIKGSHTWIATGGKASRVLYSPDKGVSWSVSNTPIVQGEPTTGIYSMAFFNPYHGYAIGGDYKNPKVNDTIVNKIRTFDGGQTWVAVGVGSSPGYRSCVQYIPKSKGKELVVVGSKGIDYSYDRGETWKRLSDEGFYTIRFVNDTVAYAAGKNKISILQFSRKYKRNATETSLLPINQTN